VSAASPRPARAAPSASAEATAPTEAAAPPEATGAKAAPPKPAPAPDPTEPPVALPDVNVLVAAFDPRHAHHHAARAWFATHERFATTPLTETAFIRLVSNPSVGGETPATALAALRQIRSLPGHSFVPDAATLADPSIDLTAMVGHQQVTDLHLVNLAAASGLVLATFDAKLWRSLASADQGHAHVIPL
jgi:toxin-antitoxin system PIN domain toxin